MPWWIGWFKYGVSERQVLQCWRLYRDGKLGPATKRAMKLLPVSIAGEEVLAKPGPTEEA